MIGYLSEAIASPVDFSRNDFQNDFSSFCEVSGDILYQSQRIKNNLYNLRHSTIDDVVIDLSRINGAFGISNKSNNGSSKNERSNAALKPTKQSCNDILSIQQCTLAPNVDLENNANIIKQPSLSSIDIFRDKNIQKANKILAECLSELGYNSYIFDLATEKLIPYCEGKDFWSASKLTMRIKAYVCRMVIFIYVNDCLQTSSGLQICEMIMTMNDMKVPKNIGGSNFYKFFCKDATFWTKKPLIETIDIFENTSFHKIPTYLKGK